jgi:hypothetical protein
VIGVGTGGVDERWLFEVELWTVSRGTSAFLVDVGPYESCRVAGVVQRLTIDPRAGVIQALISDGTASVLAQWSMCGPKPQFPITLGQALVLEGVTGIGPDGQLILREASFETVSFPDVA